MVEIFSPQRRTAQLQRAVDDEGIEPADLVTSLKARRTSDVCWFRAVNHHPPIPVLDDLHHRAGIHPELAGCDGVELNKDLHAYGRTRIGGQPLYQTDGSILLDAAIGLMSVEEDVRVNELAHGSLRASK